MIAEIAGCACGGARVVPGDMVHSQERPRFRGDVLPVGAHHHPRGLLLPPWGSHQPWEVTDRVEFIV